MAKWAVVTGASSGIGAEMAGQLAKRGYSLILTARREDRLRELAKKLKTECEVVAADLSVREGCEKLFHAVSDREIEVFINNAGFGDCCAFTDSDLDKELSMIDLNIRSMHILMKLFLQKMQTQKRGYILNVASSAGLLPAGPYMATYYATKSYVTSITQAVAQELKESGSGVYVGALCPGPVETEFNAVANVEFALKGISARNCARYAVDKMLKRKVIIIPTAIMKAATTFGHIIPRNLAVRISSRQQKKKMQ